MEAADQRAANSGRQIFSNHPPRWTWPYRFSWELGAESWVQNQRLNLADRWMPSEGRAFRSNPDGPFSDWLRLPNESGFPFVFIRVHSWFNGIDTAQASPWSGRIRAESFLNILWKFAFIRVIRGSSTAWVWF